MDLLPTCCVTSCVTGTGGSTTGRSGGGSMGTDDLLCAACGGRVGDARCPTCRAARQHLRDTRPPLPAGPVLLAALLVLVLLLVLA